MTDFKRYSKDDKAVRLWIDVFQSQNGRPLDHPEDLPGTLNNVEDLRARRASGESWENLSAGVINTPEEEKAWALFTEQVDADIEEANGESSEGEESEEESEDEDEEETA